MLSIKTSLDVPLQSVGELTHIFLDARFRKPELLFEELFKKISVNAMPSEIGYENLNTYFILFLIAMQLVN